MRRGKEEHSAKSAERFGTVGEVIRAAVECYQKAFPEYDARQAVASMTGLGYKYLCSFITDDRMPRIDQFSNILRVCHYPEGFDHLKRLNFPQERSHDEVMP